MILRKLLVPKLRKIKIRRLKCVPFAPSVSSETDSGAVADNMGASLVSDLLSSIK